MASRHRRLAACGAAAAAVLLAAPAGSTATPGPRTLLRSTRPVGVAQSAGWIAWADSARVHARRIAGGPVTSFDPFGNQGIDGSFVISGSRVIYTSADIGGSDVTDYLASGTAGHDRSERSVYEAGSDLRYGIGERLAAFTAGGGTVLFSLDEEVLDDPDPATCDLRHDCHVVAGPGSVRRVVGSRSVPIPGVPGARLLAAAGERFADVPRDSGSPIEVRRLRDGAVYRRIVTDGPVWRIALTSRLLVAGVATSGGAATLRWYDPLAGRLLGQVALRAGAGFSVSGSDIVYSTNHAVRLLDTRTGRARTIATERGDVFGASILGGRVIWTAEVTGGWAVRALDLQRRGA